MKLLSLCCLVASSLALQLPSDFPKCKLGDPKMNECLMEAVFGGIRVMEKGMPEFQLESIQPITVPSMSIGGGTGAVQVVQRYKNFQIFNVAKGRTESVDSSITDREFKLSMVMHLEDVDIVSQYKLNGSVLLLPIFGEGEVKITMTNTKVPFELIGEVAEKKGTKYADISSVKMDLNPAKVVFDFKNLFKGDPRLGPEMNNILNENWKEIFNDVKHGYNEALSAVAKNIANQIFRKVPYDDLFL
ncbi:circadian clock-controlled protein-like [Photinus pyralis]|uniref:circadian clock-controlled protein-like n=1 Tax=Photinus pyralis TaxID=7054 RepID=UPI00126720B2|nr:circadian clock-controlled protein-like [Photinus pyralis]